MTWRLAGIAAALAAGAAFTAVQALARQPRLYERPPDALDLSLPPIAALLLGAGLHATAYRLARRRGATAALGDWLGAVPLLPAGALILVSMGLVSPERGLIRWSLGVAATSLAWLTAWSFRARRPPRVSPALPNALALVFASATILTLLAVRGYRPSYDLRQFPRDVAGLEQLRSGFVWLSPYRGIVAPMLPVPGRVTFEVDADAGSWLRLGLALPADRGTDIAARVTLTDVASGETLETVDLAPSMRRRPRPYAIRLGKPRPGRAVIELSVTGSAPWLVIPSFEVLPSTVERQRTLLHAGDAPHSMALDDQRRRNWWKTYLDGDARNALEIPVPGRDCVALTSDARPDRFAVGLVEGMATGEVTIAVSLRSGDGAPLSEWRDALDWIGWRTAELTSGGDAKVVCIETTGDEALGWSVALAEGLPERGEPNPRAPNLMLVSLDTLRADAVGALGNRSDLTPTIDALARTGTTFANAQAAAAWTLPSHISMLTGLLPSRHQVWGFEGASQRRIPPELPLISSALRDTGYSTAATTGGVFVAASHGFARGFDRYVDPSDDEPKDPTQVLANLRSTLEQLEEPFFLFVHSFAAHEPYGGEDPPPTDRYRGDAELARHYYDEGVRLADGFLESVLAALRERGLFEKTIVIVTSDHGEEFGEHHPEVTVGGHGHSVFEEVTHVPLLFAGPGIGRGVRIEGAVSGCDIAPTLMALAGVAVPSGLDGIDLTPFLANGLEPPSARVVLSEQANGYTSEAKAARGGERKLIVELEPTYRTLLFDLGNDPFERSPLPTTAPRDLSDALASLASRPPPIDPSAPALTPNREEQLRALGYLQ